MDKKKILIVDDKEQIAKILYAYLQADYACYYVQNPLHAIKWLHDGNMPDLIISDIRLGTHPPAGRGCGRLHRQTVQPAGAQNTH